MADTPDYELLKDAFAIIGGIPPDAVTLDWTKSKDGEALDKGALYHPARWLSLHPAFQKRGLTASENGKQLLYPGAAASGRSNSEVLAQLFGIPVSDAINLFVERGAHMGEGQKIHHTDKDIWLDRVRHYLTTHGALKQATRAEEAVTA
jgi:hypothetical protein